jgi:hypothetical protein
VYFLSFLLDTYSLQNNIDQTTSYLFLWLQHQVAGQAFRKNIINFYWSI